MDRAFRETLDRGAEALGLDVSAQAADLLERYADRLLAWNRKVNLTAITAPAEVAEKHLLDSLLVRALAGLGGDAPRRRQRRGAAGHPPRLRSPGPRGHLLRFGGEEGRVREGRVRGAGPRPRPRRHRPRGEANPGREGLPQAAAVISRAVAEPELWVPLGKSYLAAGGVLLAMLGRLDDEEKLREIGAQSGLELAGIERYELPFSRSARAIARWVAER